MIPVKNTLQYLKKKILSEILSQASMQNLENKKMQDLIAPQKDGFHNAETQPNEELQGTLLWTHRPNPSSHKWGKWAGISDWRSATATPGAHGHLVPSAICNGMHLQHQEIISRAQQATASNKMFPDWCTGRIRLLAQHSSTSHTFAGLNAKTWSHKDFNTQFW